MTKGRRSTKKQDLDLFAYAVCEAAADLIDPAKPPTATVEQRGRLAALLRQIAKRLEPESKAILEEFLAATVYGALKELQPGNTKKLRADVAKWAKYKNAQTVSNAVSKCGPGVTWWLSDDHLEQFLGTTAASRAQLLEKFVQNVGAGTLLIKNQKKSVT